MPVLGLLLGIGLLLCLAVYLVQAVPGRWFPSASPRAWGAADLKLVRGAGGILGDELVVTAADSSGTVLVSVNADLLAADFAAIAWVAADIADDADVHLIWRSDAQPQKINAASLVLAVGRPIPVKLGNVGAWSGRVTGLALVIRANLAKPIRIRGVVAKPMGAVEILRDRAGEWLAFEEWTGTSINTVVGGADVQDLPLPPLIAAAGAVALALWFAVRRMRPGLMPAITPGMLLALFALAWLALDARWTWNLVRQEQVTVRDYGGKNSREKHLAAEDAALFEFVERARGLMPAPPARVFVVSDEPYFSRRAAYHLYPHNPFVGSLPMAGLLRPGDWVLAYAGRGIAYDQARGELRWGGNESIAATPKLIGPGAALFLIR